MTAPTNAPTTARARNHELEDEVDDNVGLGAGIDDDQIEDDEFEDDEFDDDEAFEDPEEDEDDDGRQGDESDSSDDARTSDADADIEEDLGAILKHRLGTTDDDDEDDDDEQQREPIDSKARRARSRQAVIDDGDEFSVQPRHATESVCDFCFLIISRAVAAKRECPHCGADRSPKGGRLARGQR